MQIQIYIEKKWWYSDDIYGEDLEAYCGFCWGFDI
jgi:hypothetical protein